jgi:hypothetical protein
MASWAPPISIENTATASRFDGHVFADVDGERRLTHRRTAGHDHQIARLQARGHAVEVDETGRHAGDFGLVFARVQFVDTLDHLGQQRLHGGQPAAPRAPLGNREDLRFGLVEHLLDFLALRAEGLPEISSATVISWRSTPRSRTISA